MNTTAKAIVAIAGLTIAAFAGNGLLNHLQGKANERIQALEDALTASKVREAQHETERKHLEEKAKQADTRSDEWKAQTQAAIARVAKLEGRMKQIETKLADLGPAKPPTDAQSLPGDAVGIAARITTEGLPARAEAEAVAMDAPVARAALGLIIDGKEYPKALERTGLLEEQVGNLKGQRAELEVAVANQEKATNEAKAAYQTQVQATAEAIGERDEAKAQAGLKDGVIKEKDALLKAEAKKKWFWGGGGIGIALLVLLL